MEIDPWGHMARALDLSQPERVVVFRKEESRDKRTHRRIRMPVKNDPRHGRSARIASDLQALF